MSETSPKTDTGPRTRAVLFEAIFIHGLETDPAFDQELKRLGFDREHMAVSYPQTVFAQCLELAARQKLAHLPLDRAYWELGKMISRGFEGTIVGKVMSAGFSLLGPMRVLRKFPSFLSVDETQMKMTFRELGPRSGALDCEDPTAQVPEFLAGSVEGTLVKTTRDPVTVTLKKHGPGRYTIEASW